MVFFAFQLTLIPLLCSSHSDSLVTGSIRVTRRSQGLQVGCSSRSEYRPYLARDQTQASQKRPPSREVTRSRGCSTYASSAFAGTSIRALVSSQLITTVRPLDSYFEPRVGSAGSGRKASVMAIRKGAITNTFQSFGRGSSVLGAMADIHRHKQFAGNRRSVPALVVVEEGTHSLSIRLDSGEAAAAPYTLCCAMLWQPARESVR